MDKPVIDVFCRVVDNLGDIGVTWRLARQLSCENKAHVRLIVDDLTAFQKLEPEIAPLPAQSMQGVEILHWDAGTLPAHYRQAGQVVIEAFACALPDFVVDLMRAARPAPVWIDLEYLSAEDWVEDCHAVVSPHPSAGIDKTLFFPGFTTRTGGLLREDGLLQHRDAFQASAIFQNIWRVRHGLPVVSTGALDISLFCYPDAPVKKLIDGLKDQRARIFAPREIAASLLQQSSAWVEVYPFSFLSQHDYDRLLWTCGLNFVRGEDSFVRALWAGRPYVWNIYKQADDAHMVKLEAFLRLYTGDLGAACTESLAHFNRMWNLGGHAADTAAGFYQHLPALTEFARQRAAIQAQQDDLATQLMRFIETQQT